jgi:two-component system sensor kinase FixL
MSDESRHMTPQAKTDDRSFRSVCEAFRKQHGELLDSMPDGVVVTDTSGRIVLVNSQIEALFGYGRGDLVSLMIERLVPVHLRENHVAQRNSYFANPHPRAMGQGGKLFGFRQDGSEFPVEISLSPMKTDAGLFVCAAVRDVTQRMRVEDALHASDEKVRLLLDSTAEAIYGLDVQGICTFCNQACLATLGYDRAEELLGQNIHNLIHHTRSDGSPYPMREGKIYESILLGKGTHVVDEVLWRADGSSFPTEYRSFPVRRDGELIGSVVTFLDITEQKRIAKTLRTQRAELAHASRLSTLGEMAAGLAHELNQPLTAMSAFAEGALVRLDRGKLRETEIAPLFSKIAKDAQRAGEIIRRLRNFVQKRDAQHQEIEINQVICEVSQFIESDVKQQEITIQLELGNDLSIVEADSIQIQQVLLNLIRNARDAISQSDSSERNIVVSSHERNGNRVEVVVEDSGPGISNSMAEQVFEPFYTSKSDGLGIGLGICQTIIESHGGKIWLGHSSMGGASAYFDLPAKKKEEETDDS